MITIRNTENITGVTIRGDFDDLYKLVDAFHEISINEEDVKNYRYFEMSTSVMGSATT